MPPGPVLLPVPGKSRRELPRGRTRSQLAEVWLTTLSPPRGGRGVSLLGAERAALRDAVLKCAGEKPV